ncbi:hypothetical protein UA08_06832 [Talaromyces atroroseus]|uniref:Uncharacterized protein n=1 Tax=Talaromyces atroroseus TaxID=1441469 RepID=A0A225AXF0_TALAT|nr:hypothetical protein UA08_06832 [Talaromyces atroroseus]OKL58177.1 hypothetical protein UA08_06832 [Talaromyces atroroseus]
MSNTTSSITSTEVPSLNPDRGDIITPAQDFATAGMVKLQHDVYCYDNDQQYPISAYEIDSTKSVRFYAERKDGQSCGSKSLIEYAWSPEDDRNVRLKCDKNILFLKESLKRKSSRSRSMKRQ